MKCRLCNKETTEKDSEFCRYHNECVENVEAGFEKWRQAYGELDWQTYLKRLDKRPETGIWIKEYCDLLKKRKDK